MAANCHHIYLPSGLSRLYNLRLDSDAPKGGASGARSSLFLLIIIRIAFSPLLRSWRCSRDSMLLDSSPMRGSNQCEVRNEINVTKKMSYFIDLQKNLTRSLLLCSPFSDWGYFHCIFFPVACFGTNSSTVASGKICGLSGEHLRVTSSQN